MKMMCRGAAPLFLLLQLLHLFPAWATKLRGTADDILLAHSGNTTIHEAITFQSYYEQHKGRGMWKWNVALDMYQRHLAAFAAKPANIVEIGVQSGGSIMMYQAALPQCKYYGMDINQNCAQFKDAKTSITIGDQASVPVWQSFFASVVPAVDILIDDGGHQTYQMLATLQQALPRIKPGGFFLTEDIHGQNDDYLTKFMIPASYTIGNLPSVTGAKVESVHMYPFIVGVQMAGGAPLTLPAPAATVKTFDELGKALPQHLGGAVALANPSWGSFLAPEALTNIFRSFYDMYGGSVRQEPANCHGDEVSANCVMIATNTHQQNLVKGVHITHDKVLVEVHKAPPTISATRKGQVWIPYAGPKF